MLLGHFGLALAAKRFAPRTSAGTTTAAAQLADLVWPVLLLCGVEEVRVEPGHMAASAFDFVHYPWTHSLLMQLVWGALFAAAYFALKRDRQGALVVGLLVPSHWALDLLVHGPDLPLWPGGPRFGLGAWGSIPLTLALEALFFVGSLVIYTRATTPKDSVGRFAFYAYVATLVLLYLGALFGPTPVDVKGMAGGALSMWLLIPWASWFDRHRTVS